LTEQFGRLLKTPNVQSPGGLQAPSKAAVDAACKDKKPGDVVKVDGKDVKCPAPKSAPK
jgi:hypothetical protein